MTKPSVLIQPILAVFGRRRVMVRRGRMTDARAWIVGAMLGPRGFREFWQDNWGQWHIGPQFVVYKDDVE